MLIVFEDGIYVVAEVLCLLELPAMKKMNENYVRKRQKVCKKSKQMHSILYED